MDGDPRDVSEGTSEVSIGLGDLRRCGELAGLNKEMLNPKDCLVLTNGIDLCDMIKHTMNIPFGDGSGFYRPIVVIWRVVYS